MEGQGYKICKGMMIAFNVLFMLGGLGILATGVWVKLDGSSFNSTFSTFANLNINITEYMAYGLIGLGAVIAFVSFLGCCGAWKESKCLLCLFFVFTLIFLIIEVGLAVGIFVYSDQLKGFVQPLAKNIVKQSYGVENSLTDVYDGIHRDYECCGFSGGDDFTGANYLSLPGNTNPPGQPWPDSCCKSSTTITICRAGPETMSNIDNGCYDPLKLGLDKYINAIAGASIGLACIQFLSLIFTCCVYCSIGKQDKVWPG